jgi:hypothetical protein
VTDALWAPVRGGHDKSEIQQIQIESPEGLGGSRKNCYRRWDSDCSLYG